MVTTGKLSFKPYRCQCGKTRNIQTNHWGECYSPCEVCWIERKQMNGVWTCLEAPPEGVSLPEPWGTVTLGDLLREVKDGDDDDTGR